MAGGRPTKYKAEYVEEAGELCRQQGYTDKNLAAQFKVSEKTINVWKKQHPQFLQSLKKGKDEFDSQVVEQSLLKRATGYSYDEITKEPAIVDKGEVDAADIPEGETAEKAVEESLVVTKIVRKGIAPDVTAQIFWLKNRQPHRWSDKKEIDHRVEEVRREPITVEEIKRLIAETEAAGTGLDSRSIEGVNGGSNGNGSAPQTI